MKQQNELKPRYSTVDYSVLKALNISPTECVYLDMVYYLSRDGWCHKSLQSTANDLNMSKSAISYLRDRLVEKKLLTINGKRQVKTAPAFNKTKLVTTHSVQILNDGTRQSFKNRTERSNIEQNRSNIGTKNNNRITKNYIGFNCPKHVENFVPPGKVCGYC